LNDEKTNAELKGLDFEADLVKLYGLIRKRMAEIHPDGGFGPVAITEIAEGLDTQELVKAKLRTEEENKAIKNGYERVKIKSKEIRQRYRKAVSEGTGKRSGDHWETLKSLWGGSPATVSVGNSVSSLEMDGEREPNPFDEWDYTCPDDQEDDILSEGVCDTISETSKESSASQHRSEYF